MTVGIRMAEPAPTLDLLLALLDEVCHFYPPALFESGVRLFLSSRPCRTDGEVESLESVILVAIEVEGFADATWRRLVMNDDDDLYLCRILQDCLERSGFCDEGGRHWMWSQERWQAAPFDTIRRAWQCLSSSLFAVDRSGILAADPSSAGRCEIPWKASRRR